MTAKTHFFTIEIGSTPTLRSRPRQNLREAHELATSNG